MLEAAITRQQSSRLLQLSPELRLQIYEQLLLDHVIDLYHVLDSYELGYGASMSTRLRALPPILSVCQTVRQETYPIYRKSIKRGLTHGRERVQAVKRRQQNASHPAQLANAGVEMVVARRHSKELLQMALLHRVD